MKRKNGLWIWVSLAGIALFLCFPAAAGAGVRSGLALCGGVLIPSLFPVSVLAGCLIRMRGTGSASSPAERWMRALFRLPGAAALDIRLMPGDVRGEDGLDALCALMRGFVALGGFFLQPDIADAAVLILSLPICEAVDRPARRVLPELVRKQTGASTA